MTLKHIVLFLCSNMAAMVPISKAPTIPTSAIAAISQEKVNATQLKFQNFDSELTQLISGLKSNLKREDSPNLDDDKLLLDNDVEPLELTPTKKPSDELIACDSSEQQVTSSDEVVCQSNVNKALADIVVDLNDVRPHDDHMPQCIFDEKSGLKIVLNFTKDKPRSDVAVLVITTTNHNSLPVKNFQFEASVPKVSAEVTL